MTEVAVVAADAEFCAEQTLTALAAATMIIAVLRYLVNFILINFLVCCLCPSRVELRLLLGRDFSKKNSLRLTRDSGLRPENRVTRCLSEDLATQALQPG